MPKIDNEKFYSSAIEKHGINAKGVNWANASTQKIRFSTIVKLLPKELYKYNIIDAGCGFGDFYFYLKKNKTLPKNYIGIDCHNDMVSIASNNTGCKILNLDITKDDLPRTDFVICSGAMNVLNKYETFLFIKNCFLASELSFVFNILHGDKESETYNYITKKQIELFAKELDVKKVTFLEGYLDADITVRFDK
ncbi:class I SAM-dependent methyltransferase [Sulfurimonas lithotrophica]|uniref:Class I SAM-dependent methyltransferase n=1 Tax=Sulfurimonas lithotrophica TaxID=2590022 RepID=A0A5P8NY45_9BACT|nr:class I SAM-dependent methyltransferase [Sulfurimonas lithotrophica]QFR48330.1 class I SAM-dependent methyltransferase [Sulfurimonas lithotrophica]